MQTGPENRTTIKSARAIAGLQPSTQESHRLRRALPTAALLMVCGAPLVFGQQQCTREDVSRVFTGTQETATAPIPEPSPQPKPIVATARPKITRRSVPGPRNRMPMDPVTALTVPPEEDVYEELKRCEREWKEQGMKIWKDCGVYSCTPPHCTDNSPHYACQNDQGGEIFLSLDLDRERVTISRFARILDGTQFPFPNGGLCDDLADAEMEYREGAERLAEYLGTISSAPPVGMEGGRLKFSLRDDPCDPLFSPTTIRLIIDPSMESALIFEGDNQKWLEGWSPDELTQKIISYLDEPCLPPTTY